MIIQGQESQTIEFKKIWKDEYLKTICAFANSDGGVFYIGVDDNGLVVGIDDAKILLEKLPNKINNRLGLLVDDCVKMNLPEPDYKYTQQAVQVFLYKTPQKTPQKSTKENIVNLMQKSSKVTILNMAKELGLGKDTINEHIAKLKKENKIKRVGGRKDGYWKVLDDGK